MATLLGGVALLLAGCGPTPRVEAPPPPVVTKPGNSSTEPPKVDPRLVQEGEKLYKVHGCDGCHKIKGVGADVGPDLTREGARRPDMDWQIEHLKNPDKMSPGSLMTSFAELKPEELKALAAYVVTRR